MEVLERINVLLLLLFYSFGITQVWAAVSKKRQLFIFLIQEMVGFSTNQLIV